MKHSVRSKSTTAIKKFRKIFVSSSPKKGLRLSPQKPQVTDRTTPIVQSKCTIYGQIFKTKAVRSNPIRPIHVVHMCR